jgi:hypothetical protein
MECIAAARKGSVRAFFSHRTARALPGNAHGAVGGVAVGSGALSGVSSTAGASASTVAESGAAAAHGCPSAVNAGIGIVRFVAPDGIPASFSVIHGRRSGASCARGGDVSSGGLLLGISFWLTVLAPMRGLEVGCLALLPQLTLFASWISIGTPQPPTIMIVVMYCLTLRLISRRPWFIRSHNSTTGLSRII